MTDKKAVHHKVNLSMNGNDVKRLKRLKKMTGAATYSAVVRAALVYEEVRIAQMQVREAESRLDSSL